jgi:hypothetical protein
MGYFKVKFLLHYFSLICLALWFAKVNDMFLICQVAVLVEMLPVSGVPIGSSVAGVSVLPAELISTKPRLSVRSLASDAKATKK